jgi:integrase
MTSSNVLGCSIILPTFGGRALTKLMDQDLEAWATERRGQIGPSAYNKEIWVMKNLCRVALRQRLLLRDPSLGLTRRRESHGRVRFLTPSERDLLLNGTDVMITASDGRRWKHHLGPSATLRIYMVAALQTGMRRGELLRLVWTDVDLGRGHIKIANHKNGDTRHVTITPTMRDLLRSLPRSLDRQAQVLPPIQPLVLTRSFARHCERVGIKDFTFHDLRHDVASQLAMAGVPIRTIAQVLGHRKLEMTLRYAHLSPDHLREAMTVLHGTAEGKAG